MAEDTPLEMGLENVIAQFARETNLVKGMLHGGEWIETLMYMEMTGNKEEVEAVRLLKAAIGRGMDKAAAEIGLPPPPKVPRMFRPDLGDEEVPDEQPTAGQD